jgi:hypothetical protein
MKGLVNVNIIVFLFFYALRMPGQDIGTLLPELEELPGWTISQEPQIYAGDQLFELIDGGADIYLEYGFAKVVSVQYKDPSQNNIQVEIYEMTDAPSAYGIFSITQQVAEWSSDYGTISAVNDDYISFWKSRYYVNLSWSSRQHIDKPLLVKIAGLVDGKIKETGNYPDLLKDFSSDDSGIKTIYLKGNLALSNFYYFDYKDVFQAAQGLAWAKEGYHMVIFFYPDPEKALEVMTSSKQGISNNKRFADVANTFQGYSCRDNKGNMILLRQVDNFIVVLVGLDPNISLASVMDQVSLKIESISR